LRYSFEPLPVYNAGRLMIAADGGCSNGSRMRLFKVELQKLADETGLMLQVCHFSPGTSKWNEVEGRLQASLAMGVNR